MRVANLPKFNISNDVFAASAAECADKCWDQQCTTAGFIPTANGGVCLLSKDSSECRVDSPLVAQYGDSSPFVISCIRCSGELVASLSLSFQAITPVLN